MKRRMILNAFHSFSPVHHDAGQWKRPGAAQLRYNSLDYWVDMAETAERGKMDAIFLVDSVGTFDAYGNSAAGAVEDGVMFPLGDPMVLIASLAAATKNIGLVSTVSTTYSHPYFLARALTSLDHLTRGRVGMNIVTSFMPSVAAELGVDSTKFERENRYKAADEFMEVMYKLWEGSWEEGATLRDQGRGMFADPAKIHPIEHRGEFYQVTGLFPLEPSPQRTPFLYQAGASDVGLRFAARHAEGQFIICSSLDNAKAQSDRIRSETVKAGREPDSTSIVMAVKVITAATDEEAQEKAQHFRQFASVHSGLVSASAMLGTDLASYDLDTRLHDLNNPNITGFLSFLEGRYGDTHGMTVRNLGESIAWDGMGPLIIGSPKTVADELERWMDIGGVDGFNVARVAEPECLEDFVDLVIPELQARGRVWTEYPAGTLREKSTGGSAHAPSWHPASAQRGAFAHSRDARQPSPGLSH